MAIIGFIIIYNLASIQNYFWSKYFYFFQINLDTSMCSQNICVFMLTNFNNRLTYF